MKILRYELGGETRYGVLEQDGSGLELAGSPFDGPRAGARVAGLDDVRVLAPVVPSKIICVGLNYVSHIEESGLPIAAPSANRSGFISPTSTAHVLASLDGRIDAVIDGGMCEKGLESTIAAVRADGSVVVLRPGPILLMASAADGKNIEAPGQLASHYAPGKPVRLMASEVAPDEFLIGFGDVAGDCSLSDNGDLTEAASRLYACLHDGALSAKPRIAVAEIPEVGVGIAINDRLRRAATPPD